MVFLLKQIFLILLAVQVFAIPNATIETIQPQNVHNIIQDSRILLYVFGERGHFAPMILIAKELAMNHRAKSVFFVSHETVRDWIPEDLMKQENFQFMPLSGSLERGDKEEWRRNWQNSVMFQVSELGYVTEKMVNDSIPIMESLVQRKWIPDMIICDGYSFGGFFLKDKYNIPNLVVNVPVFIGALTKPNHFVPTSEVFGPLFTSSFLMRLATNGIDVWFFIMDLLFSFQYNRVLVNNELEPVNSVLDYLTTSPVIVDTAFGFEWALKVPPNVFHVGAISAEVPADVQWYRKVLEKDSQNLLKFLDSRQEVVYISMGTLVNLDDTTASEIFKSIGNYSAVWSIRQTQQSHLPAEWKDSQNILVENWVNQPAVLAHPSVKVFVSHCGMNSVQESILEEVPVICIPYFGDQHLVGFHLQDTEAGVMLLKEVGVYPALKDSIHDVLTNSTFKNQATRVKKLLKLPGGVKKVSEIVAQTLEFGSEHLVPKITSLSWTQANMPFYLFWSLALIVLYLLYKLVMCVLCCGCRLRKKRFQNQTTTPRKRKTQ